MSNNFIPPNPSSIAIKLTKLILPLILSKERLDVRATANCVTTIRELRGVHTVLLLNHSDRFDPVVAFALSKFSGEEFLYLAAREIFTGFQGWCMQRCGAYSVMRGDPEDLESKEATISVITRGDRNLIMFPEGDVTGRDDEILPLKEDGILNMFEAQRRIVNQNKPVRLLPVAVYYEVQDDAIQPLMDAVSRLELRLGLTRLSFSLERRLMRVVAAFLEQIEEHYGLNSGREFPPDYRLLKVSQQVVGTVAQYNGINLDPDEQSERALLYSVRGQIERILTGNKCEEGEFGTDLSCQSVTRAGESVRDLDRMQQLLILASTVQQNFTLESAWRIIDRLEYLIIGRTHPKGHRTAWLESAQPVDLLDMWPFFLRDQSRAVSMVDRRVRTALNDTLHQLREKRQLSFIAH